MTDTISMFSAVTALALVLALVCTLIYAGMRTQSSLLWLAGTLVSVAAEIVALQPGIESVLQTTCATVLHPLALFCGSQTVRLALGRKQSSGAFVAIIALLVCVSLVLAGVGMENVYQTIPSKVAAAMGLADILWCLGRIRKKTFIDYGLLFALAGLSVIFLLRIPIYPTIGSGYTSIYGLDRSEIESLLLTMTGVILPSAVLLLVAKIFNGAISNYRDTSERDVLTNLFNRRAFERMAEEMNKKSGVVVLCDIDHFKRINDHYGHPVGDDVLRALAVELKEACDDAARIGGEEFAMILPGASVTEAVSMTIKLRMRFDTIVHPAINKNDRLTASFGVAEFTPNEPFRDVMAAADAALYRAKNAGRDRIAVHPNDIIIPHPAPRAA